MRCRMLVLSGLIPLLVTPASAQRVWLAPDPGRNIGVEVVKQFLKSGANVEFASFVVTADARFPVNNRLAVTAALPFARVGESGSSGQTSTALGNPWVGIEAIAQPNLVVEAGIRPGMTSDAATSYAAQNMGFTADYDRFEAWLPKETSVRAMAHVGSVARRGTFVTGMFGGTLFLPSGGGSSVVYANYGVRLGVRDERTLTSLSLTGRVGVSHGAVLAGSLNHTVHEVTIMVEGTRGSFRPRMSIGSFVNPSIRDFFKAVVTVGATVTL